MNSNTPDACAGEFITLSFITVCYNRYRDTCELADSLLRYIHNIRYEIIIVDNASTDSSYPLLKERYSRPVRVIRSEINLGFAGGNNLGIAEASGKYLFFINNDTYIDDGAGIISLICHMEENDETAGVSPKIKFASGAQHIQFAGYTPLSPVTLRNRLIGFDEPDDGRFDNRRKTPYLHGAAMMIKRKAIESIGCMPEMFFLYYEELDWSTRFTEAGYNLWYDPAWVVFHKESQSTGSESPARIFYLTRNRLLYAWRNLPGGRKWLSVGYQLAVPPVKNTICYAMRGKFSLIKATYKGIYGFVKLVITTRHK